MLARVSTIHGSPEHVEEGIQYLAGHVAFRQAKGFKGNYLLVDRTSGKLVTITLWETEADLQATTEAVNPVRQEAARLAGTPSHRWSKCTRLPSSPRIERGGLRAVAACPSSRFHHFTL